MVVVAYLNLPHADLEFGRIRRFGTESRPKVDGIGCSRKEKVLRIVVTWELDFESGFNAWSLTELGKFQLDKYRMSDMERPSTAADICYRQYEIGQI